MALLIDSRIRVTTAAGVPISGGKVRVYNAGTTTLTTLYSDSGLTTPLTNPVVALADGWCAQIFAAEGTLVDMQTETAAGVVLKTYVNVVFLGSNTGAISRDFLSNGRVTVRGTGGYPNLEFGDATGDDTGGTGRIGGWLGTQADLLTLDAALTNTTGKFKENSKKILGVVYTEATTFTAASTVDIALPNDPTGVRVYELEIFDCTQTGASNFALRMSFNSGASYDNGATDYNAHYMTHNSGTPNAITGGLSTTTYLQLSGNLTAYQGGTIRIITPTSGTQSTRVIADIRGINNGGAYEMWQTNGAGPSAKGRCTNIRLMQSGAQTMTGKYVLRVLRGTGDA